MTAGQAARGYGGHGAEGGRGPRTCRLCCLCPCLPAPSQHLLQRQLNEGEEPQSVLPEQVLTTLSAALGEDAIEEELVGVPQR